jgi:hypothetical protein
MMTNLPVGPEVLTDFEFVKDKIQQKSSPVVEYQILELTDTSLTLGLELRGMQFEMHFQPAAQEQVPAESMNTWPHNQQDSLSSPVDSLSN